MEPFGVLTLNDEEDKGSAITLAVIKRDFSSLAKSFVGRALEDDGGSLFNLVTYLYQHQIELWEIFDNVVSPAMEEIGALWHQGEIGINHEHRASYRALDALTRLQSYIWIKPSSGRSVLCACPEKETHEIGLRCASYIFEEEGWRSHYLGACTPAHSIIEAIKQLHPAAVCLSITDPPADLSYDDPVREVMQEAKIAGSQMIIGGAGARGIIERLAMGGFLLNNARSLREHIGRPGA